MAEQGGAPSALVLGAGEVPLNGDSGVIDGAEASARLRFAVFLREDDAPFSRRVGPTFRMSGILNESKDARTGLCGALD